MTTLEAAKLFTAAAISGRERSLALPNSEWQIPHIHSLKPASPPTAHNWSQLCGH